MDLQLRGPVIPLSSNNFMKVVHTRVSDTKQYNVTLAKERGCSTAGMWRKLEVTAAYCWVMSTYRTTSSWQKMHKMTDIRTQHRFRHLSSNTRINFIQLCRHNCLKPDNGTESFKISQTTWLTGLSHDSDDDTDSNHDSRMH